MALDTVVQNIGEYYSAHYLDTTFAADVKAQISEWKEKGSAATPRRLQGLSDRYFKAKALALEISDPARRFVHQNGNDELSSWHSSLLAALGYVDLVRSDIAIDGGEHIVPSLGEVNRFGQPWLVVIEAPFCIPESSLQDGRPSEDPLELQPFEAQLLGQERKKKLTAVEWSNVIGRIFKNEQAPRWVMLLAGSNVLLLDGKTYSQGRYLAFDLDDAFSRKEKGAFECLATFLSADTLCPGADKSEVLHDKLEEQSHKFAHGVSARLQFAVREAIELLANEWVEDRRRQSLSYTTLRSHELLPDGGRDVTAEHLRHEALVYVYRMLFCLYAEAHGGDLGILPISDEQYRLGYSFEALRDLELVPLTPAAEEGIYFHDHLKRLFAIIHEGFHPDGLEWSDQDLFLNARTKAFQVRPLTATLFDPNSTPLLSRARLTNRCLQQVVRKLSLTQDERGKSRGRVNYAELGINQLGAVYEGLLSYKGMFAEGDLIQVKPKDKDIDDTKTPSWFVPKERLEEFHKDEVVRIKEGGPPRIYLKGTFILHLSGIDREQSASYYTPEVLTKCLVEEALRELLKDFTPKDADRILELKICEPAMGSGAFLNEAAGQLAHKYLELKQVEINQRIDPTRYNDEHRRVKHYIASRNIYGVDLNPTAVELGSLSLWLGCMHRLLIKDGEGKEPDQFRVGATPWFGLRLRAGNSLIGARRAVWTTEQLKKGLFLGKDSEVPRVLMPGETRKATEIYHFLVFDEEMIPAATEKQLREFYPKDCEKAKQWINKVVRQKWAQAEIKEALLISDMVDQHWDRYAHERIDALRRTECVASIWPTTSDSLEALKSGPNLADQEMIRATLESNSGSFRRLKLLMDSWCTFWFWSLDDVDALPTREGWLASIRLLLGGREDHREQRSALAIRLGINIDALIIAAGGECPDTDSMGGVVPWFHSTLRRASSAHYFHWALFFPEILYRGVSRGFDLVLGNPPWANLAPDPLVCLVDIEPKLGLSEMEPSSSERIRKRLLVDEPSARALLTRATTACAGGESFLTSRLNCARLTGVSPNLYKNFVNASWDLVSASGVSGLLHPQGIFEEEGGDELRYEYYRRLRGHYQFRNELKLFQDIGNSRRFSINISGPMKPEVEFSSIFSLFHPATISECMADGAYRTSGNVPPPKTNDGNWQLRGHPKRRIIVNGEVLAVFRAVEGEKATSVVPRLQTIYDTDVLEVLTKLSKFPTRLESYRDDISAFAMFDEKRAQLEGILTRCSVPSFQPERPDDWVLVSPHIYDGCVYAQTANAECTSHRSYSKVDLRAISPNFLPRSPFRPGAKDGDRACFDRAVKGFASKDTESPAPIEMYRYVNRRRIDPGIERSLISGILPPGVVHIDSVVSLSFSNERDLVLYTGFSLSLVLDFLVRVSGKVDCRIDTLNRLPMPPKDSPSRILVAVAHRALRLTCVSRLYADLWFRSFRAFPGLLDEGKTALSVSSGELKDESNLSSNWTAATPLRSPAERRSALIEIDVLTSIFFGLSLGELTAIYRNHFTVLESNERRAGIGVNQDSLLGRQEAYSQAYDCFEKRYS